MKDLSISELSNVSGGFICPAGLVKGAKTGIDYGFVYALASLFSSNDYAMGLKEAVATGAVIGASVNFAEQSTKALSSWMYSNN